MTRTQWIAIDWDHTAWNNGRVEPAEGFREALDEFHSRGWKVIIHSCNSPAWIRQMCEEHDLRVDAIWGERDLHDGAKPVASIYIDDRGYRFEGDWTKAISDVIQLVSDRPVRR